MLKEISEQAETVRATLRGRLLQDRGTARLHGLNLTPADCRDLQRVVILACGTSWHAGLVGRHLIEDLAGLPVQVEYASEFRYRRLLALPGTLTIAISQSGETADTLEAMRAARAAGSRVVGIVNVVGSTIAREADGGIYLHAGPEIGVASTKAFTCQIVALALLGLYLGRERGLSEERGRELAGRLIQLPQLVTGALALEPRVRNLAARVARAADGRHYRPAGPQIGAASTKAFTGQILGLALLGLYLGRERGLSEERGRELAGRLIQLPQLVTGALALEPQVRNLAEQFARAANVLFLGRGVKFAVALGGGLKIKEISYIHGEGF